MSVSRHSWFSVLEQVLLIIYLAGGYPKKGIEPTPTQGGCKNWQKPNGSPPTLKIGAHCDNNKPNEHPDDPIGFTYVAFHKYHLLSCLR
jgi:hypothetical protein